MFSEWLLGLWSGAGIAWWLISWGLVKAEAKRQRVIHPAPQTTQFLSIFKPLPPLGPRGLRGLTAGLESFISQLDEESELLLGIHEVDRESGEAFVGQMKELYPQAQLKVIFRTTPDEVANPKIAWQKVLASQARGELWLWSDADIIAPPGFLAGLRGEYACRGAAMLTFPYVVQQVATAPAFLDALYVNAEFYPGVLLLRRMGPVDFGLGAGMLFRRDDFLREVKWTEIGSALADDFMLGQKLRPVRLSETTLGTISEVERWREALLHYLRWSKTVWWNRPVGSAARVLVLPILGWALYAIFHPTETWAWAGLVLMMQVDVFFAGAICRAVGCRWTVRDLLTLEAWSLWRVGVWVGCWLPWPIVWRGRGWWKPRK